jgi:hypothetical protein
MSPSRYETVARPSSGARHTEGMRKIALMLAIVCGAALVHVSAEGKAKDTTHEARTEAGVVHYASR